MVTSSRPASRSAAPQPSPKFRPGREQLHLLASYAPDALEGDSELAAIARFAAHLCQTPVAGVTVAGSDSDRLLAGHGSTLREIPREIAFCPYAMGGRELMEVADTTADSRFAANPSVTGPPHVRFYAGQPLISPEGVALGTLSVLDVAPRPQGLSELQREGLAVLAESVVLRLRAHRKQLALQREAEEREQELRTLIDSIPAIAWSATPDGHFEYFNKRMVDFTGRPDDQEGTAFHPEDWKKASAMWQHSLKTGEVYEVQHRLCRHDGQYRWMMSRAVPVRDSDGRIVRWFGTAVDIHEIYAASETRDLLARELSHRIKNIFAVVAGLVSLNIRRRPEMKDFGDDIIATIRSLGRAHDFVRPVDGASGNNLQGLLAELFAPYGTGDAARVHVSGDELTIQPNAASPLALVFHELATNAAKYGALSNDSGHVDLKIRDAGEKLEITWSEHGGPPVDDGVDKTKGFGSRLIEMSLTGQLGGDWERRFESEGLVVELTVSKERIAA